MANLSAPRNTVEFIPCLTVTGTAGGTIYPGGMVCLNGSGALVAAADEAGYKVVGRAEGYAASGGTVTVKRGCFKWDNDSTNGCEAADIGKICYVVDDHTVGTDPGTNAVIAGYIAGVDADGVRVSHLPVTAGCGLGAPSAAIADVATVTKDDVNAILAALRKFGIIAAS